MLNVLIMLVFAIGSPLMAQSTTSSLYELTAQGTGKEIGTITVTPLSQKGGIRITVKAKGLPAGGEHGFHLHETNTLHPTTNSSGVVTIGGGAGGHWDPDNTGKHLGPNGNGHRGDLPHLKVKRDGTVDVVLTAKRINYNDIKGKSFMIHLHGDNYSDDPEPLGGGGARLYAAPF